MDKKNIPNLITTFRLIGTVLLLFWQPLSKEFYVVYAFLGVSDVLDGWTARKLKVESAFGAKLDSIADLLFYTVMMIRIFPILWEALPKSIWIVVGVILIIRIISYAVTAIRDKEFASMHTAMNKMTGFCVFLLPYSFLTPCFFPYSVVVCAMALVASIQELQIHLGHVQKQSEEERSSF